MGATPEISNRPLHKALESRREVTQQLIGQFHFELMWDRQRGEELVYQTHEMGLKMSLGENRRVEWWSEIKGDFREARFYGHFVFFDKQLDEIARCDVDGHMLKEIPFCGITPRSLSRAISFSPQQDDSDSLCTKYREESTRLLSSFIPLSMKRDALLSLLSSSEGACKFGIDGDLNHRRRLVALALVTGCDLAKIEKYAYGTEYLWECSLSPPSALGALLRRGVEKVVSSIFYASKNNRALDEVNDKEFESFMEIIRKMQHRQ